MNEGEFKKRIENMKTHSEEVWKSLQYGDDMIEVWQVNNLLDEVRKDIFKCYRTIPHNQSELVEQLSEVSACILKWFGDKK